MKEFIVDNGNKYPIESIDKEPIDGEIITLHLESEPPVSVEAYVEETLPSLGVIIGKVAIQLDQNSVPASISVGKEDPHDGSLTIRKY